MSFKIELIEIKIEKKLNRKKYMLKYSFAKRS